MNKHHPHNDVIEKKLEQLPGADADKLWNDMHSILDKKMPQKKERRRFIVPILFLTAGFIIGTGTSLFFLSNKENPSATITKLTESSQSNKINENDVTIISRPNKENIKSASESDQTNNDNTPATRVSTNAVGHVIDKSLVALQTTKRSEKYTTTDQFSQEKVQFNLEKDQTKDLEQSTTRSRESFDITTINLKSNYSDLIAKNNIEEKISLNLEPVTYDLKKQAPGNKEHGLYTGLMSGVDLSSTNFRSVKTGSTKGFIIGYAFNNRWSLESGLLWDTKRVYDNGKNFNPPGYTPSGGITIMDVNGKSSLYELPVNVRYSIIPGDNRLFVTTGLSSYFMRLENYDYEYMQNSQPVGHNYLSYKNETQNWFSVANFSVGYTHKFGALGSLRVEPYLKLPIQKIGVGKMPIMSTGLNIGFTKTLR